MAVTAITAAVGIAGGIAAQRSQSEAIKKSGQAQREAAAANLQEQRRQFDLNREDFAGFRGRGEAAGEQLAAFAGSAGVDAQRQAFEDFTESPGQAFLRARQEKALLRNEAKIGGIGGGNVRTALQDQAFGIASQQLGQRTQDLQFLAGQGLGAVAGGAQIGSQISGRIGEGIVREGDVRSTDILNREAQRQSGLRMVGSTVESILT